MDDAELFQRLFLALAIGLLFGLERGWHAREAAEGERIAGFRTFALTGLLGGISGWLVTVTTPIFLAAALLALAGLLAVSYWLKTRSDDDLGITTEIALLLTFVLGAVSVLGEMAHAAAVAVVAAILLAMKQRLHGWVAHIERFELDAAFKLALISVVVLPLLPDQGFGPGEVLNPYQIWWAVVVVAGLSFAGYIAIRLAGARLGILATGLFGGLASSTSTTLALARMVRAQPNLALLAAVGIVLAGSVTFLRILVLAAIFEPRLIAPLALPMAAMAATGGLGALLIHRASDRDKRAREDARSPANPIELKAALSFGAVLVIVLLGVHYLRNWLGTGGVYAAGALSGLTDVDAFTISVSRLVGGDLVAASGALAVFIAASVNTVVKAAIAIVAGDRKVGLPVIAAYVAVIAVGGASLWFGM